MHWKTVTSMKGGGEVKTSAQSSSDARATFPQRIVVVGDVHGQFSALVHILLQAKLIKVDNTKPEAPLIDKLRWCGQDTDLLVQVGDVVDRGEEDLECLYLLQTLQSSAPRQVVRLVGNHELMILSGSTYSSAHPENSSKLRDIRKLLLEDLRQTKLCAAHSVGNLLFLHAGVTEPYLNQCDLTGAAPEAIATHINKELRTKLWSGSECLAKSSQSCVKNNYAEQYNKLSLIGSNGPFWVRTRCPQHGTCGDEWSEILPSHILQFVGHTNLTNEGIVNQDNKIIFTDMGLYRGTSRRIGYAEVIVQCDPDSSSPLSQACAVQRVQWMLPSDVETCLDKDEVDMSVVYGRLKEPTKSY